jgi:hypothetical protein
VYAIEGQQLVVVVIRVADRKEVYRAGREKRSTRSRPFKKPL